MSEIIKLYENAGIRKEEIVNCTYKGSTPCGHYCDDGLDCPYLEIKKDYPPFTAEKQLSLIKLLSKYVVHIDYDNDKYEVYILSIGKLRYDYYDTLEETLAYCINNLWQDLTDADKAQIKEILE